MRSRVKVPGLVLRSPWAILLKGFLMRYYVRLRVEGDLDSVFQRHKKLILIARHSSHLDGGAILAAIPFRHWPYLYVGAARDYFFSNPLSSIFFTYFIGAVPINRRMQRSQTIEMCIELLRSPEPVWLLLFPEGSRSESDEVQPFKRGASLFSQETDTPLLFLYLENNGDLWPKGRLFAKPGTVTLHVGPVHEPAPPERIFERYCEWVGQIRS